MSSLTPEQRALRARMAAHKLHSTRDSKAHLEPARKGFQSRFEREVDPDGVLDPTERARRAKQALKAHMMGLAFKSAQVRRGRSA